MSQHDAKLFLNLYAVGEPVFCWLLYNTSEGGCCVFRWQHTNDNYWCFSTPMFPLW